MEAGLEFGVLDRESCERRVYRLATLLTGNPVAAAKVIAQVVDAQPDVRKLDSAHMDRLTVLRSREIAPSAIVDNAIPISTAEALAGLSPQQREAWVLRHVYRAPDREIARAMDCSVTATQRHRETSETILRECLREGQIDNLGNALLTYSMSLDVPNFYRAAKRRRSQLKLTLLLAVMALLLGLIAIAVR